MRKYQHGAIDLLLLVAMTLTGFGMGSLWADENPLTCEVEAVQVQPPVETARE